MKTIDKVLVLVAIAIGHLFVYIDSRPTFDDTGILAFSIAIATGVIAFISSRRPWFWALLVGIWIPVHTTLHGGSVGSFLALVFAFGGAYLGASLRWIQPRAV